MNHIELHNKMSVMLEKLYTGQVKKEHAKEFFNGAGKILANCKNELEAIRFGMEVDVPLLEMKSEDVRRLLNKEQKQIGDSK